eukprot:scaffold2885_cov155-Skeletonema_marinoi.AAC.5
MEQDKRLALASYITYKRYQEQYAYVMRESAIIVSLHEVFYHSLCTVYILSTYHLESKHSNPTQTVEVQHVDIRTVSKHPFHKKGSKEKGCFANPAKPPVPFRKDTHLVHGAAVQLQLFK